VVPADPPPAAGDPDAVQAALKALSDSLSRRGYLTTEWWTTVLGGALSAVLALVHISASSATHVVAVVTPALLAALYAITRTLHKSALASLLGDAFPQATAAVASQAGPAAPQAMAPASSGTAPSVAAPATAAVAQTDPDFAFEGIPPIEVDGG
jgi:hypothetical protein